MSISFSAIGWNPQKKIYDKILLALLAMILAVSGLTGFLLHSELTAETLLIRSSAVAAFVLLHCLLAIGPLCRIDSRFLPLLYNRRHLGVLIGLLGLFHAGFAAFQFHALGNIPARVSFLESYLQDFRFVLSPGPLGQIPFEPFGFLALGVLIVMALLSHDFWLKTLGSSFWKRIHILVYVAFAALVIHVAFGFLQTERNLGFLVLLVLGALSLLTLHTIAFFKNRRRLHLPGEMDSDGFYFVGRLSEFSENKARTVQIFDEAIALYLYQGKIHAVANTCRHQGGPLGEGRILDGCITCPWHGWQYLPDTGCSPPPFQEVIPTFAVKVQGEQILVHPKPRLANTQGQVT